MCSQSKCAMPLKRTNCSTSEKTIFLSAQHASTYYLWQVYTVVYNLIESGIEKEQIHILLIRHKCKLTYNSAI